MKKTKKPARRAPKQSDVDAKVDLLLKQHEQKRRARRAVASLNSAMVAASEASTTLNFVEFVPLTIQAAIVGAVATLNKAGKQLEEFIERLPPKETK